MLVALSMLGKKKKEEDAKPPAKPTVNRPAAGQVFFELKPAQGAQGEVLLPDAAAKPAVEGPAAARAAKKKRVAATAGNGGQKCPPAKMKVKQPASLLADWLVCLQTGKKQGIHSLLGRSSAIMSSHKTASWSRRKTWRNSA